MIEFKHVSASYSDEVAVLKDVSFRIDDGDFVAFVGTNGAGKSTTMRLINGLLKPTKGEVLIDGRSTRDLKTSELAGKVGFLFQNPDYQICCNTVREELLFGFRAQGRLDDDAEKRVDEIIKQFGFNGDDEPFLLNRGSRQLLALASIIVTDSPVIVLDEPTTGLDFSECKRVMEIIERMNENKTTIIMVCHDMEVVGDYAKRVIAMTGGRIVADGETFEVLRDKRVLEKADLLEPQIIDIALRLAERNRILEGSSIHLSNSLDEMEQAFADYCATEHAIDSTEKGE